MFCPKCGNKIIEEANFCPVCGTSISEIIPEKKENCIEENTEKKLAFQKKKMLGKVVYRKVDTEIIINENKICFLQTINRFLRSIQKVEESFLVSDINEISIKTKMDFWDTLYGIIFAILGIFVSPLNFLMAAVCLFCGYGKIIQIKTIDGKQYSIPSDLKTEDVQILLDIVNEK